MKEEKSAPHDNEDRSASGFRKTGIIIILCFTVLMLIAICIDSVKFPATPGEKHPIWSCLFTFLINVAAVGITVGGGTVLYGHFDFVKYVKNTLCSVLLEYHFIDKLSDGEKEAIMSKLQKHLIYHDTANGNDTLFDFVNDEVRSLTQGPYYENMHANFFCTMQDGKLVKKIVRKMVLNIQQAPDYKFDLPRITKCYFYESLENAEKDPPYIITNLIINGENLTNSIHRKIESTEDERDYECITQYFFNPDFDTSTLYKSQILNIEMAYTTKVDPSDKTMGFRTYFPCKKLDTFFVYDKATLQAHADVFCFKDRKSDSTLDCERIQVIKNESSINISFPDWLLPGDGIIYYIESLPSSEPSRQNPTH